MDPKSLVVGFAVGVFTVVVCGLFLSLFRHWLQALVSGAQVPLIHILGMRLRGNPPQLLIDAYLTLVKSGETPSIADVETAYMANKPEIRDTSDLVRILRDQLSTEQR